MGRSVRTQTVRKNFVSGLSGKNGDIATSVVDKGKDSDKSHRCLRQTHLLVITKMWRKLTSVQELATRRRIAFGANGKSMVCAQQHAEKVFGQKKRHLVESPDQPQQAT